MKTGGFFSCNGKAHTKAMKTPTLLINKITIVTLIHTIEMEHIYNRAYDLLSID